MRTFATPTRLAVVAATIALAGGLSACSSDSGTSATSPSSSPSPSATSPAASKPGGTGVEVDDAWVKAVDSGMTGVFGTLHNHGSAEVHYVKATSSVGGRAELHETVPNGGAMSMREAADGFRIPAGGEFDLKPGGHHVMLMDVPKPITAGQEVDITLTAEDGSELRFSAVARSFQGADEKYDDDSHEDHPEGDDHNHG